MDEVIMVDFQQPDGVGSLKEGEDMVHEGDQVELIQEVVPSCFLQVFHRDTEQLLLVAMGEVVTIVEAQVVPRSPRKLAVPRANVVFAQEMVDLNLSIQEFLHNHCQAFEI